MRTVDKLFNEYGASHQNAINKTIHWVCIPLIMFSLFGLITCIPFPFNGHPTPPQALNWASVILILTLIYYLRLSFSLFIGFIGIAFILWWGNLELLKLYGVTQLLYISLFIFLIAWVGQFIGHKIEGKKPSFLKDIQFLLIGPAWLLHFIYKKLGIKY